MRFILLLKSTAAAESGKPPTTAQIQAMMSFYSKMNDAGIILAAEGLHASSMGARVTFHAPSSGAAPTIMPGPFTPAESLISGYWTVKVKDLAEALGRLKKCPLEEEGAAVEIRQIAEMDDIKYQGSMTEEIKEQAEEMKKETEERESGKKVGT